VSFGTILMILGAVAAFLYGIWAGLGTWDQSQDEIDRAISEPGRRRKATRHFTPLDLMARMTGVPTQRDRRNPFRFGEDDEGLTDPSKASRGSSKETSAEGASGSRPGASTSRDASSASQKGVDGHEDASDEGPEEVTESDDEV